MRHEDDWPASLPVRSIAWLKNQSLKDGYSAFFSLLKSEIAAGHLPQNGEPLTRSQKTSERVFMGISHTHGGAERWENVSSTMTTAIPTVRAGDLAQWADGMKLGKYLGAWLAPYSHQVKSETPQETGEDRPLTEMKRAAILSQLGRKYPSLEADFNRPEAWIKGAISGKRGCYFLELIEEGCRKKWGATGESLAPVATFRTHKMRG